MRVFITGTDTGVGKTLVSSWLCLHTQASYFKPIQTGACEGTDRGIVEGLSGTRAYRESFLFQKPLSPHAAAFYEESSIELEKINLPEIDNLIIEGAGGVMVPLNGTLLMIDLIQYLKVPVILVASGRLGTINHSLLSLEAMHTRGIKVLGVILNGDSDRTTGEAIERCGGAPILAHLPTLVDVSKEILYNIPLPCRVKNIFKS